MAQFGSSQDHMEYPFRILDVDEETQKRIAAQFLGCPSGLKKFNHWGFKLSATASLHEVTELYNHPLHPSDIWVVTPPKCGTTWTQEMVWLIANNCDYEGAKRPLMGPQGRWSFIDFRVLNDKQFIETAVGPDGSHSLKSVVDAMTSDPHRAPPRFVKSHLPLSMNNPRLLDTCKVLYVARNPKDACVSFYHHCRLIKVHDYTGDLETFMQHFMDGTIVETPIVEHMIEAWNLRHHPNLCMLFYEDMKKDLKSQIRKVAQFLNKSLSDEQVDILAKSLHIDNYKSNPEKGLGKNNPMMHENRGSFFRKGITGDWKNHFTAEMNDKFDKWLQQKMKGTDLKFVEELDHQ